MLKSLVQLSFIAAWSLLMALQAGCCNQRDRSPSLREANLDFSLLDSQGEPLFPSGLPRAAYSIDTLRLLGGGTLVKARAGFEYAFALDSIFVPGKDSVNTPLVKEYYLYLNQQDTDTIRLSFTAVAAAGDCEADALENFRAYYNNQLAPIEGSMSIQAVFTKN